MDGVVDAWGACDYAAGGEIMTATKTPSVSSVRRALSIIEVLAGARNGLGVSVVSRKIHAPKSSTHTILLTLERSGFLEYDARSEQYSLGPKFFALGYLLPSKTDAREQARPYLADLVENTGLTAHLAILDGNQIVYVEKIDSPGLVKMNTWVGRRIDAHCTALGKVLLAHSPADRFNELFKSKALVQRTARTIGSRETLMREMHKIRARGFAVDDEECGIGVRCVSSPIFDREGKAIAAIGVAGTTAQISRPTLETLGRLARDAAGKISRNLGFHRAARSNGWRGLG
jgi:IclR family transcriptional regulator, KDG regulon repressor